MWGVGGVGMKQPFAAGGVHHEERRLGASPGLGAARPPRGTRESGAHELVLRPAPCSRRRIGDARIAPGILGKRTHEVRALAVEADEVCDDERGDRPERLPGVGQRPLQYICTR